MDTNVARARARPRFSGPWPKLSGPADLGRPLWWAPAAGHLRASGPGPRAAFWADKKWVRLFLRANFFEFNKSAARANQNSRKRARAASQWPIGGRPNQMIRSGRGPADLAGRARGWRRARPASGRSCGKYAAARGPGAIRRPPIDFVKSNRIARTSWRRARAMS